MSRGNAQAIDEAAADLGLGARHAGVGELRPRCRARYRSRRGPRRGRLGHALRRLRRRSVDGGCDARLRRNMRAPPRRRGGRQLRELRYKTGLVVEAAQVEDQRAVLDVTHAPGSADRAAPRPAPRAGGPRPCVPTGAMAMPALGSVSSGSAPEPTWLVQSATSTTVGSRRPRSDRLAQPRRRLGHLGLRAARNSASSAASRQPVGIAVELEDGFQRREPDLVEAQRPLHGVLGDARHQLLAAGDDAGLRPAQQLVAGEGDEVGALAPATPSRSARAAGRSGARSTSAPEPRSCTNGTLRARASARQLRRRNRLA